MIALYAMLASYVADLRGQLDSWLSGRLDDRLDGRLAGDAGFTTLEWAVIGSIAFAMALAIGAGVTAVANTYLGKLG